MQKDAINGRLNDNSFLQIRFFPDRPLERVCSDLVVNLTRPCHGISVGNCERVLFQRADFIARARMQAAEFRICTWQPWRVGSTSSTRFE